MKYVKAIVLTNSIDDPYFRVKVQSEGLWKESDLIQVFNSIPLKKDDTVIVDVSEGVRNPVIVAKMFDDNYKSNIANTYQTLAESQSDKGWSAIGVNQNEIYIETSDGTTIQIKDGKIIINGGSLGGLINIDDITSKLNNFVNEFNKFVSTYNSHYHGNGNNGSPTTITLKAASSGTSFSKSDYVDEKVLH